MSDTQLAVVPRSRDVVSWKQQQDLALWAFKSGQFKAIRSAQHALVIMQYGKELGFGPATALQLIYMVNGIPALKANTIAALIKQVSWQGTVKNRYDYRLVERTADRCVIDFYERNDAGVLEKRGSMEYTMEDAKLAGDTGRNPNYKTRPKNMLFARCLTEGARVFAPDCLGGIVPYSTEELTETDEFGEPVQPPAVEQAGNKDVQNAEFEEAVPPDSDKIDEQDFQRLVDAVQAKGLNLSNVVAGIGADPNDPRGLTRRQFEAALKVIESL